MIEFDERLFASQDNATRLFGDNARLLPQIRLRVPVRETENAYLQALSIDGSDGTRTRDLRRDRPAF
jgi:hypothetical protein